LKLTHYKITGIIKNVEMDNFKINYEVYDENNNMIIPNFCTIDRVESAQKALEIITKKIKNLISFQNEENKLKALMSQPIKLDGELNKQESKEQFKKDNKTK